ncbi:MAG: winged helix-turn-helix domain-containing protein [bacterium]
MTFALGPFIFDPVRRTLTRDGTATDLGQRTADLLAALLDARGAPVSKADLMDSVWPDTTVEEGNLTVQIAQLRKLLGPGPDGHDWIVTVPRVGYRLIQSTTPASAPAALPTLAVLPFQALSGEAETDYFADGIVADIITALSRFRLLSVVSRSSAFAYKGRNLDAREVAQALSATYLLEGSVRRAAGRLRITAQLVDGQTGGTLWSNRFDGDLAEVFEFQDRITETVATLVAPAIQAKELLQSRRKRPEHVTTYDTALRARALIDTEDEADNAAALILLQDALVREPDNGSILSLLTWALEHRNVMGWHPAGPDDVTCLIDYARRGIRNAAGDPLVMARCAVALIQVGKDYDAGMSVLEQAVQINPHDLYVRAHAGVMTLHCGELDRAMEHFAWMLRLGPTEPVSRFALTGSAHVQLVQGNNAAALDFATRSLAINDRFDATYWMLIAANAHLGRPDQARVWLNALLAISPDARVSRIVARQPARYSDRFTAVAEGLRLAGLAED